MKIRPAKFFVLPDHQRADHAVVSFQVSLLLSWKDRKRVGIILFFVVVGEEFKLMIWSFLGCLGRPLFEEQNCPVVEGKPTSSSGERVRSSSRKV